MPSEDLLDQCTDIRKRCLVRKIWEAVGSYDAVDLCLGLLLYLRVEDHGEEEGFDGRSGLYETTLINS